MLSQSAKTAGADPGFSERGFGQTSAYITKLLLLINKFFFSQEKVWLKIFAFHFRTIDIHTGINIIL